jgi:hypothetical protein
VSGGVEPTRLVLRGDGVGVFKAWLGFEDVRWKNVLICVIYSSMDGRSWDLRLPHWVVTITTESQRYHPFL